MREGRAEAARGTIGPYHWAEHWSAQLAAADVISALWRRLDGLRAVCTSWDSAMLDIHRPALRDWQTRSRYAVSPVMTRAMAESWPRSSCGWDEWYFFRAVPELDVLHAFCNWAGISVAQAAELEQLNAGFSLAAQLERYRPHTVIGDGDRVFVIAETEDLVNEFVDLCSAAEQ